MASAMPSMAVREVEVACTARLHLGFLDLNGGLGRRFGSVGLALDAPVTRLSLSVSEETDVSGPERKRAAHLLAAMAHALRLRGGHTLRLEQAIPSHAGLGSGTQLALAVASAVRRLHGLAPDIRGDAARLGRGGRSGIGVGLFAHGGLVVDGGVVPDAEAPPPLLAHIGVPASWRVLLLLDPAHEGLSGQQEKHAFSVLRPMSPVVSAEICRLTLMQVLPGVQEDDLGVFGAAITRIQAILGDHFRPAQGGRFTSRAVAGALDALAAAGATGIGQSSWGPTGFAFARGDVEAAGLAELARPVSSGIKIAICRVRNHGADVTAR